MERMIKNVIFDWSGTLVDDLPAVLDATNHVFAQAGLQPLSMEDFRREFSLPFAGFYKRFLPHVEPRQLEQWFHHRFSQVHSQLIQPIPHAREFLEFCSRSGMRTFVLSSVREDHFNLQAAQVGFDSFLGRRYLGVWDKRDCIHSLIQENGLERSETVFVGDMIHDVETARHGGVRSCAVLTGYNNLNQLRGSEPDWIVEHLTEFRRFLESMRGGSSGAMPSTKSSRLPVVTVGALIFREDGRMLLVRTRKWSDLWGIPGGKIEWGESSEAALRRELLEETGLPVRNIEFVMVQDTILSKEFYKEAHFVLLNYRCQVDVAVGAATPGVRLNDEAQDYQWVSPEDGLKLPLNLPTRVLIEKVRERL